MRILVFLISLFSFLFCSNSIYSEFGGAGYTKTLNYDRKLNDNFSIRAGYGFNNTEKNGILHFYPIEVSFLINKVNHGIEVGLGRTFLDGILEMRGEVIRSNHKITFIGAGYRKYLHESNFFVGLKLYFLKVKDESAPWAGISTGLIF